jgi:hypothetical protein
VGPPLVAEPVDPERLAFPLQFRHHLRWQLAPLQYQDDARIGLPERPRHPVVQPDSSDAAQQPAGSHQVEGADPAAEALERALAQRRVRMHRLVEGADQEDASVVEGFHGGRNR